jgi:hypothetical protein
MSFGLRRMISELEVTSLVDKLVANLASNYFLVLVYREPTYVAVRRNITKISQKSHLGLDLLYHP